MSLMMTKRFFALVGLLATCSGCAAMEQNYRETYCNYDGAYKKGYNDARERLPMDEYVSNSCLPDQRADADRGYADGYRNAVAARSGVIIVPGQPVAPGQTVTLPPGTTMPPQPPGSAYSPGGPPSGAAYPPPPPNSAGAPPPAASASAPPPPPGRQALPPPSSTPPPPTSTSAYPPPGVGQGAHSIPTQATCTMTADCPINQFCKDRGDGTTMCLGDGTPGLYCSSSEDCQHGLTCRPVGGALSTCQ